MTRTPTPDSRAAGGRFGTTRWSLVLRARGPDRAAARAALGDLCAQSWRPLYTYLRRRGQRPEDAADLVQSFLARLIENGDLARLVPERGRLRSYLLTGLQHHAANAARDGRAWKRGGGRAPVSFDYASEERRAALEPVDDRTPERAYERQWALERLGAVLDRLRAEYRSAGRGALFEHLTPCLTGGAAPHAELARRIGTTEGTVRVAVHRLRRRYGELLRCAIAETVDAPEDVEDELRHLMGALAAEP